MRSIFSQKLKTFYLLSGVLFSGTIYAQSDECATATPLTISSTCSPVAGTTSGSTLSANAPIPPPCIITSGGQRDVWYSFVASEPAHDVILSNVTVTNAAATTWAIGLAVYSGSCIAPVYDSCDNAYVLAPGFGKATAELPLTGLVIGNTYYVRVWADRVSSATDYNFDICVLGTIPLPAATSALSGILSPGNVPQLSWNTLTEHNNKGFEIQRADDSKNFRTAGFVGSQAKDGNSKEKLSYNFTDREKINGLAYYRLQQTDRDGKTAFSNVVRLSSVKEEDAFSVVVAPNPVKDMVSVNTYGIRGNNSMIYVTDVTGKVISRLKGQGPETKIDLGAFANGIYLIRYVDDIHTQTVKVNKK